jgi:hypothetical protein
VISLIPGQEKQLEKLKAMRVELQKEVRDTIDEFGPKIFDDYDDVSPRSLLKALLVLTFCVVAMANGSADR